MHACVCTNNSQLFEDVQILTFAFANFYITYLSKNLIANVFIETSIYPHCNPNHLYPLCFNSIFYKENQDCLMS